jgi:hypothetical protein
MDGNTPIREGEYAALEILLPPPPFFRCPDKSVGNVFAELAVPACAIVTIRTHFHELLDKLAAAVGLEIQGTCRDLIGGELPQLVKLIQVSEAVAHLRGVEAIAVNQVACMALDVETFPIPVKNR